MLVSGSHGQGLRSGMYANDTGASPVRSDRRPRSGLSCLRPGGAESCRQSLRATCRGDLQIDGQAPQKSVSEGLGADASSRVSLRRSSFRERMEIFLPGIYTVKDMKANGLSRTVV